MLWWTMSDNAFTGMRHARFRLHAISGAFQIGCKARNSAKVMVSGEGLQTYSAAIIRYRRRPASQALHSQSRVAWPGAADIAFRE